MQKKGANTAVEREGTERPVSHLASVCHCWGVSIHKGSDYFLLHCFFEAVVENSSVLSHSTVYHHQIKRHVIRFVFSQRRLMLTHSCPFLLLSTSRVSVLQNGLQIVSLALIRSLKENFYCLECFGVCSKEIINLGCLFCLLQERRGVGVGKLIHASVCNLSFERLKINEPHNPSQTHVTLLKRRQCTLQTQFHRIIEW